MIEGFKGAAKDEDSDVTWNSLSTYVQKRVPAKVREIFGTQGGAQSPNALNNLAGEPAVLARIMPGTRLTPTPEPSKSEAPELLISPFDEKEAGDKRRAWARHLQLEEKRKNSIGMELLLISPGRFAMGSSESPDDLTNAVPISTREWFASEQPVHRVIISRPFYMGKYEVAKGQFKQFVDETGHKTDAEKDGKGRMGYTRDKDNLLVQGSSYTWRSWGVNQGGESPVVNVSHDDAVAFCEWLHISVCTT